MRTAKKKPVPPDEIEGSKFKSILLISIYRYAKLGMPETAIADAVHVTMTTWYRWKKKFPSIPQAIQMGRTDTQDGGSWHKFVYDRLPEDIKAIWDRINEWDELPNGMAKIEALLSDHGKDVRQQLFLYALIQSNFSASRACAKVNIDKTTLDYWITNDPGFADLVEEIQWHKGNFYEESLVGLIKSGDAGATIYANRSFNKDRGYGVRTEVSGKVEHQHEHSLLDLSDLDLAPEVRIAVMNAIRVREKRIADEKTKAAMPAEFRVLSDLSEQIAQPFQEEVPCGSS